MSDSARVACQEYEAPATDDEERYAGNDVPEIWDTQQCAVVRKRMVCRVLGQWAQQYLQ